MKELTKLNKQIRKLYSEVHELKKRKRELKRVEKKETKENEIPQINHTKEFNYVKRLLFKDYIVKYKFIKTGRIRFIIINGKYQWIVPKYTGVDRVRIYWAKAIRNSLTDKSLNDERIENTIRKDFEERTMKDPKYKKLVEKEILEQL